MIEKKDAETIATAKAQPYILLTASSKGKCEMKTDLTLLPKRAVLSDERKRKVIDLRGKLSTATI